MFTGQREQGKASMPLKERLSILVARIMSRIFWAIPLRIMYWIADRTGELTYLSFPTYRNNVIDNLSHVLGEEATAPRARKLARQVFRNSARNFSDLMRVPHLPTETLVESVVMTEEHSARLHDAMMSGNGAVFVTAHYGAFDYVGQIFWTKGYSLTMLIHPTVAEFIDLGVTYLRGSRGATMVKVSPGGLRKVLTALKKGKGVGLVADRDFFQNGKEVTFFGKRTTLPPGPVRLARDSNSPIVPIFTRRVVGGYKLLIDHPFYVQRTDDADRDISCALQRLVSVFERYLIEAPDQWVMFQRVWDETPPQPVRVFPIGSPMDGEIMGPDEPRTEPLTAPPDPADSEPQQRSLHETRPAKRQETPEVRRARS